MTVFIANKSMNVSRAAKLIKANGANMIFPKGIAGELVRFVARDFMGLEDKVWGACAISEFSQINDALRAI